MSFKVELVEKKDPLIQSEESKSISQSIKSQHINISTYRPLLESFYINYLRN